MSKVQFWAIMYALCNIVSNTEKTKGMEGQWGVYGLICFGFMVLNICKERG